MYIRRSHNITSDFHSSRFEKYYSVMKYFTRIFHKLMLGRWMRLAKRFGGFSAVENSAANTANCTGLGSSCAVFLACVHLALFLALSLSPGNSLVSSWCDHSMIALTVYNSPLYSFVFFAVHETCRIFLSPFMSKASRRVSSFLLSVQLSQAACM